MAVAPAPRFIVRPPQLEDAEAVVELLNVASLQDTGSAHATVKHTQRYWARPSFDREHNAWVMLTPQHQLAGYIEVGPPNAVAQHGYRVGLVYGAVHLSYLRQGVGTRLVQQALERFQQLSATHAPDRRTALRADAWSTNIGAQRLFEQAGFAQVRSWFRFEITMTQAPPAPQHDSAITICTFERVHHSQRLYETIKASFRENFEPFELTFAQWEHDYLDDNSRQTSPFDPTLWFVAIAGEEIVGGALCRWERPSTTIGHVTDVFVHPAWRRRGIALALLQRAFGEFYQRGRYHLSLGCDAENATEAPKLYSTAGMQVVLHQMIYEKECAL